MSKFQKKYPADPTTAVAVADPIDSPTDEELLREFRSQYSRKSPEELIYRGAFEGHIKAGELVRREQEAFLANRRGALAGQRANAEARAAETETVGHRRKAR